MLAVATVIIPQFGYWSESECECLPESTGLTYKYLFLYIIFLWKLLKETRRRRFFFHVTPIWKIPEYASYWEDTHSSLSHYQSLIRWLFHKAWLIGCPETGIKRLMTESAGGIPKKIIFLKTMLPRNNWLCLNKSHERKETGKDFSSYLHQSLYVDKTI